MSSLVQFGHKQMNERYLNRANSEGSEFVCLRLTGKGNVHIESERERESSGQNIISMLIDHTLCKHLSQKLFHLIDRKRRLSDKLEGSGRRAFTFTFFATGSKHLDQT